MKVEIEIVIMKITEIEPRKYEIRKIEHQSKGKMKI